jgi:hypothetical protein
VAEATAIGYPVRSRPVPGMAEAAIRRLVRFRPGVPRLAEAVIGYPVRSRPAAPGPSRHYSAGTQRARSRGAENLLHSPGQPGSGEAVACGCW